jgi:RNA-dependent RNA polymerase
MRLPGAYESCTGVGTISPELADDITKALKAGQKRPSSNFHPRVFQIRMGGVKGMTSVDYRLAGRGRLLSFRESMAKFKAPHSLEIEIAKAFHTPSPMMLNRPLIMLLECLGVDGTRFVDLQTNCVANIKASTRSLSQAASMLESYGLGASYRLPSVFLGLHKLGLDFENEDQRRTIYDLFKQRLMSYAVNHVLRDMKHYARIPVPGAYTLGGVADIYAILNPFEIFACVQGPNDPSPKYLKGDYIVTRSPVSHPGDVQLVRAVGRPTKGSPYDLEPLKNTVVFPTTGTFSTGNDIIH